MKGDAVLQADLAAAGHRPNRRLVFHVVSSFLLAAALTAGRLVLVHGLPGERLLARGLLADAAMAACLLALARLLRGLHIAASAAVLFLGLLLHLANLEMAAAMNTYVFLPDLHFAADGRFLQGSLHLSFPVYSAALVAAGVLFLISLLRLGRDEPVPRHLVAGLLAAALLCVHFLSGRVDRWQSANMSWLSLTRSLHAVLPRLAPGAASRPAQSLAAFTAGSEEGRPLLRKAPGERRNVLIVVLEGIPGAYLRQVREHAGVSISVRMPQLSRIAEDSVVVPNFVAHNRQTIRGLYSLLSGDYSKLSLSTPKIYEYMSRPPQSRGPCLPSLLASRGYSTAYLQAAELGYMSKDRFMSAAGFRQVLGRQYFRYQYVPFGWGPDDKAFFEQAGRFIEELDGKGAPWMVTLLTVGTHHPGAVPEAFAARFPGRREAAAAYLDEALGGFYERLREAGILKKTLVLFVSDESHGVAGQPYGRFWALAVVHAPESRGAINPGVFGLIDVPCTVLDYLGMGRLGRFGRSLLRRYQSERPMLFESFVSEGQGSVSRLVDDERVEISQSNNGELFSGSYLTRLLAGAEGRRKAQALKGWQAAADASLAPGTAARRRYRLLQGDLFELAAGETRVLSSGQYLDIPARSSVTVELEAAVRGGSPSVPSAPSAAGTPGRRQEAILRLRMMEEGEGMAIPEPRIPALHSGERLRLSFSFYCAEHRQRIWAFLQASVPRAGPGAELAVQSFSVAMRAAGSPHAYRLNRLRVR